MQQVHRAQRADSPYEPDSAFGIVRIAMANHTPFACNYALSSFILIFSPL